MWMIPRRRTDPLTTSPDPASPTPGGRTRRPTRRMEILLVVHLAATVAAGVMAHRFMPRSFLARRVARLSPAGGGRYLLVGNPGDVAARTTAGLVLAGGGADLDEAFRWMIGRSGGGDFLVVRTTGTDAYNDYVFDMTAPGGIRPDSVATLIIPSRAAASDPFVAATIRGAEALFIAGGDQAQHVTYWRDTPVADAINAVAARGTPVGGTSSGLAVMGQFVYSAESDGPNAPHLTSTEALRDPFHPRVTLRRDFLRLPHLDGVLLEPHFAQESRHGRMAAFLGRIAAAGWAGEVRGLGIERRTALLVEPDGRARVIAKAGHSLAGVFAFRITAPPAVCEPGRALTIGGVELTRIGPGGTLDLRSWASTGGEASRLSVEAGRPLLKRAARGEAASPSAARLAALRAAPDGGGRRP
jgi:cyanophycinase